MRDPRENQTLRVCDMQVCITSSEVTRGALAHKKFA